MVILIGIKKYEKEYEKEYEGDYEMFESLFEEGVIDEHIFENLRKVHAYDSLVTDEIYDNHENILRDIGYAADSLVNLIQSGG